jgi:hypothetical protein
VVIEYWFDEPRAQLRTVVRRGGVVVDEFLQTRAGATSGAGRVRTLPGVEPALDPALAGFVTGYRDALRSGEARVIAQGELDGRRVAWLLLSNGDQRERVAVDAETYAPVLVTPFDQNGRPSTLSWRVRAIETVERVHAEFARPRPQPAKPFRGDVRASRPVSSSELPAIVSWPALWLSERWGALRLVSLELQTVTRGYPPGSRVQTGRGEGVRLRYAVDGERTYVELSQAPFPEPAYAFVGSAATFGGNPIPREGEMELVELPDASGRGATVVGQLRRDGVYVTIWASSRRLCLGAARALRRMAT